MAKADPELLKLNLDVLKTTRPESVEAIEKAEPGNDIKVLTAESGDPVPVKGNTSLHSRRDPKTEAMSFATGVMQSSPPPDTPLLVFGFGFGYHLHSLTKTYDSILVFEPYPALLKAAFEHLDLRYLLARVQLIVSFDSLLTEIRRLRPVLVVHRPSERLHPVDCARISAALGTGRLQKAGTIDKILLIPPIRGGSLPIAGHAGKALRKLGREVIEADMTDLASLVNPNSSDKTKNQAIGKAETLVAELAEKHAPDLMLALAQAPLTPKGLADIRRSGIQTAFWFVEDYRLFGYYREIASSYDYFFHIQGPDLEKELRNLGVPHFHQLPLAADPDIFKPIYDSNTLAPYKAEISFMGAGYPNRKAVFQGLLDYDLIIWGTEWDLKTELGKRVRNRGRRVSTETSALIFNAGKINLNLHSSTRTEGIDLGGGFINPRTFEIAACGAFQLADHRPELDCFFNPGEEIAVYSNESDLRAQIDFYLEQPELRADIARHSREKVLSRHTYIHRMREMLDFIHDQA